MNFDTTQLEYGAIGAICQKPEIIPVLAAIVKPDDFVSSSCGELFSFAVQHSEMRRPFDPVIAADFLSSSGVSDPRSFISQCIDFCPSTTQAELYATEIRKAAEDRRLRENVDNLLTAGSNDLAAGLAAIAVEALKDRPATGGRSLSDVARKTYDGLFQADTARIDTGFGGIDSYLKGLHAGELCVIGARPGGGKSAFGLTIGAHAARKGKKVLFYSLEMSGEELCERLSVQKTNAVCLDDIIDRRINEKQAEELAAVSSELAALQMTIFDRPNATVSKIRADALTVRDVALIVVDYLGLITPEKRNSSQNRNLELGQISRDLKRLAMELHIPIVALSQLNREKDNCEQPALRDLRDSGEIEQNADKVIFLWRYDEEKRLIGVDIAKNRRGRTGATLLFFDGAHMRFSSTTERYEPKRSKQRGFLSEGWDKQ